MTLRSNFQINDLEIITHSPDYDERDSYVERGITLKLFIVSASYGRDEIRIVIFHCFSTKTFLSVHNAYAVFLHLAERSFQLISL